ncbi:MAG: hypothetical protein KKD25_14205 [Gammaproteobacteria bacterium]|jgi:hypothetical protein|nr:hypothetical protein [Gammaproteobacteria bacterium]MBU0773287.1 hypothetical protein [Gammaproteobacteria bacterium]MBU0857802.1 hypothetical protein [Gammaproteobacteria bacterium]MBU1846044.1 hypothetical protein [Gammaproteobacteria bacterium]
MNTTFKAIALSALLCTSAWAGTHAGSVHPAKALRDRPPANIATTPALPPGVELSDRKVHAGHEHPVIEGHDHPQPSATETRPALPPGVELSDHKVHAGHDHPVIEGHDHPLPTATESHPALPPGVRP